MSLPSSLPENVPAASLPPAPRMEELTVSRAKAILAKVSTQPNVARQRRKRAGDVTNIANSERAAENAQFRTEKFNYYKARLIEEHDRQKQVAAAIAAETGFPLERVIADVMNLTSFKQTREPTLYNAWVKLASMNANESKFNVFECLRVSESKI